MPTRFPPSQLLKAVLDVTETSANAVDTAEKQQEGGQSYGASVAMSLGTWSPLYVAAVSDRAVPVHLGLAPASCQGSSCAHPVFGEHLGTGPFCFRQIIKSEH